MAKTNKLKGAFQQHMKLKHEIRNSIVSIKILKKSLRISVAEKIKLNEILENLRLKSQELLMEKEISSMSLQEKETNMLVVEEQLASTILRADKADSVVLNLNCQIADYKDQIEQVRTYVHA